MIYDLTMKITSGMLVYPGDPAAVISQAMSLDDDGCEVKCMQLGTHTGTHVDLPAHFIRDGAGADKVSLDRCFGKAVVLSFPIDLEGVRSGDIALVSTGWENHAGTRGYFSGYPVLTADQARRLVKAGVKAVGIDTPSVDCDGEAHKILLSSGIPVYEGLINLEKHAGKRGYFYGFPLKIDSGDGSPVRAALEI